ncbi:ATP-binding cassette domain-containing protein [Paenibacillus sp. FSL K6-1558]|uniref:ATP-binding cassette domain-containing protein n=1 Tax=Paenibacillus sp. FSL K6-1558 TaxID=2921473 RepID=UPI0012B7F998|nr:ABC transporter ATP-binding protein [Paenibacillus xylanexedens]
MDLTAIRAEKISKVYKLYKSPVDRLKESLLHRNKILHSEHHALHEIDLTINKGEIVGIIGENGSGKSTLLKIITGVLTPSGGEIEVKGRVAALLELGAGFNLEYTGIENIYLNGLMMGFNREEITAKLDSILSFAELGDYIYQPVKTYSSGMFARLAFSVAINVQPDILIVDEALSVGDMYFQAKCVTKMKELFHTGVTVLYVSHDLNSIKSLCNKALYLKNGTIEAYGEAENVVDMYAKYVREQMNISLEKSDNSEDKTFPLSNLKLEDDIPFKENLAFEEKVKDFRQGTKEAVLTELELLDERNNLLYNADFNDRIKVRMHIRFNEKCQISVGYHIRDKQNIEYLGSNTLIEEIGEISGEKGQKIIVEFITRLPLVEGRYNLSTVLSTSVVKNRTSVFVDYTENSYIFEMREREPYKIWNKLYVPNEVNIKKIN